MSVLRPDYQKGGRWVQRGWIGEKYVWTVSGVLWNNLKERCKEGSATQTREPTYIGAKNEFKDFQEFVIWHRNQVGYGLGYELDSDILKEGHKVYSKEKCLLIPSQLNRFLQSYEKKRGLYPQGMSLHKNGLLDVRVEVFNEVVYRRLFRLEDIHAAKVAYKREKDKCAIAWVHKLKTDFTVDHRVIEHMKKWRFEHDNSPLGL